MPNNFRLTGTRYISKAGHDSNDGLTQDTPKKTIDSVTTSQVLGAGIYSYTGAVQRILVGDGDVKVTWDLLATGTITSNLNNIKFFGSYGNNGNTVFISTDCVFDGNLTKVIRTGGQHLRSKFLRYLDSTLNYGSANGGQYYDKCVFIQTHIRPGLILATNCVIINSYFDFLSIIEYGTLTGTMTSARFGYNNVQGIVKIGGLKYAIKDQFSGTPQDAGYASDVYWLTEANLTANGYTGTITGWNTAVATCINRDPRFNDASKLDFTLKADSPHIGRATDGVSNIGGTSYAQSFYAGIASPNILLLEPSSTIDTTNNSDWKLQSGEIEGTIRAIIKVANTNEVITSLPYIGNKAFNSDLIGGTSTNFNVPDSKPTTSAYPSYLTTTSTAVDTLRVVIANHGFSAGVWLKVDGQYREVASVTTNELIFLTAVRGIVSSGTAVQVGGLTALSSLNPNRLNYLMRSSVLDVVDSYNWDNPLTWDNNSLADAGDYLEQEWDRQPLIDNLNKCGFGDDNYDANYGNPIQVKYIDIIIYLRNNYKS